MSNAEKVMAIIIIAIIVYGGITIYGHWQAGMSYQRDFGGFFKYADEASDAQTKAEFFNQYVEYIEANGLNKGCDAVFFCEQPQADLALKYKTLKSIQNRLNELKLLDEKDTAYQLGMTQITENEFESFPVDAFRQGYFLKHGYWGMALLP